MKRRFSFVSSPTAGVPALAGRALELLPVPLRDYLKLVSCRN